HSLRLHFCLKSLGSELAHPCLTKRWLAGLCSPVRLWENWLPFFHPCLSPGKTLPSAQEMGMLQWVFGCPFEEGDIAPKSFLSPRPSDLLVEIGPRLNFSTAYSTNAVSVCLAAGLENIDRVDPKFPWLSKTNS
uniref:Uncharacterized protein n=1 Tax=Naja naja TaxID=35670 RepID=A0A8C7E2P5_NAJNA